MPPKNEKEQEQPKKPRKNRYVPSDAELDLLELGGGSNSEEQLRRAQLGQDVINTRRNPTTLLPDHADE